MVAFQVQIDQGVFADLVDIAREKFVTPATCAQLIIELAVRSPTLLKALFDDAYEDRRKIAAETPVHVHTCRRHCRRRQ
jgi:hypothetical protein